MVLRMLLLLSAARAALLAVSLRPTRCPGPRIVLRAHALRLRGGLQFCDGNEETYVEVETLTDIEQLRNSLDPADYPPLEVQYNEHGEMVFPPPINLEVSSLLRGSLEC